MIGYVKRQKEVFFVLVILNALIAIAAMVNILSWSNIGYFYWCESVLLASFFMMTYAKRILVFIVILAITGFVTYLINDQPTSDIRLPLAFWSIYCLTWLGYMELGKSRYWLQVRRLHPISQLFIYLFFMIIAVVSSFALTATLFNGWAIVPYIPMKYFMILFGMAAFIPTLAISILKIIDMIGAQHFMHFLIGTYHRPVERERVVLFLDMVGSSSMAEKLDPEKGMRLISNFIYDSGAIIRFHGGDIINYTGDGLVVLWPREHAHHAMAAVKDMRIQFEKNHGKYISEFGLSPDFRIGIHAGKVMISQIGEEKLFIGLYGDVVNTAARLEQLNKELKTKVLISEDAIKGLSQYWLAMLKPMGEREVRGRDGNVNVFAMKDSIRPNG